MTQSVELMPDAATDTEIRAQWDRLGDAGLPTARRTEPSPHHAPHLTLWAGDTVSAETDAALPGLFRGLDLEVVIGSLMLFGPRRGAYVLVRQVPVSAALIDLQQQVAEICQAHPRGQFGDGRWSPHITLARRLAADQVGPALAALDGSPVELTATVRRARRWDGDRKRAWWLSAS
ncbi:MAG TPA: 2'-5' RNA ligase family protein [Propionibacteriaceae bacterium]|nr:2'-5' RNA ligase family protein [Propionibacteriaceae bacterium]